MCVRARVCVHECVSVLLSLSLSLCVCVCAFVHACVRSRPRVDAMCYRTKGRAQVRACVGGVP